jgi:hypothetical protein
VSERPPTKRCPKRSKRTGQQCQARIPVWAAACRWHGGASARARAAAEVRRVQWEAAQRTDDPVVSRNPAEALIAAAQQADVMAQRLQRQLDETGELSPATVAALMEWLRLSAQLAKVCLDTGAAERLDALAERNGNFWAGVVKRLLGKLALSPEQWAIADAMVREAAQEQLAVEEGRGVLSRRAIEGQVL